MNVQCSITLPIRINQCHWQSARAIRERPWPPFFVPTNQSFEKNVIIIEVPILERSSFCLDVMNRLSPYCFHRVEYVWWTHEDECVLPAHHCFSALKMWRKYSSASSNILRDCLHLRRWLSLFAKSLSTRFKQSASRYSNHWQTVLVTFLYNTTPWYIYANVTELDSLFQVVWKKLDQQHEYFTDKVCSLVDSVYSWKRLESTRRRVGEGRNMPDIVEVIPLHSTSIDFIQYSPVRQCC